MKIIATIIATTLLSASGAFAGACCDAHNSVAYKGKSASLSPVGADIVDTAVAADDFNTLAAALGAAGLIETLKDAENITVFAPTDAAFAALPEGTVEMLLQRENRDLLISILTYHVVPAVVMAENVASGSVPTLSGEALEVVVSDEGVMVGNAMVVATDIVATNGVIHVVNAVILPPSMQ